MQEHNISESNFEQCLKCDLCTSVCPMMEANPAYPGPKQAGPDGERYRLKDPGFFDLTLRFCLNCKRCEVACPSGVKVGDIIQRARLKYYRQHNVVRDLVLASTDTVGPLASAFAPLVNAAADAAPLREALDRFGGVSRERRLPAYSRRSFVRWMRHGAPSQEGFKRYVSYFHGCYVNYNYPQLGQDFVTLMNACGYGVRLLEGERCCGVALISGGFGSRAARHARANVRSMERALGGGRSSEAVLTTSSTCTFTMRDEYESLLGVDTSAVRPSLMMAVKWLYDMVDAGRIRLVWREDFRMRAVYHTACHMNKLGWAVYAVGLLRMIPGLELTVLEQECCGMAGTFGFKKENLGYSRSIGSKLFDHIREALGVAAAGGCAQAELSSSPKESPFGKGSSERQPSLSAAAVVITDCETCKWQIEEGTGLGVLNPVSVLVSALDLEATSALNR